MKWCMDKHGKVLVVPHPQLLYVVFFLTGLSKHVLLERSLTFLIRGKDVDLVAVGQYLPGVLG